MLFTIAKKKEVLKTKFVWVRPEKPPLEQILTSSAWPKSQKFNMQMNKILVLMCL